VPNVTPEDYRKRLQRADRLGVVGAVGRVDFCNPPYETERTLDTPNSFNIVAFSRLLWDPQANLDELWQEWAVSRYGKEAATWIISALNRTGEITDKIWYHRGFVVINYHNMIPHVHTCETMVWQMNVAKWDISQLPVFEKLEKPDQEFLATLLEEKDEALALVDRSQEDLECARTVLKAEDYTRLRYYFDKLREAGEMWRHLTRVFFHHRMVEQGNGDADLLATETAELLKFTQQLESKTPQTHGFGVHALGPWPVRALERGIGAREFVAEIYRDLLYPFLKQDMPMIYGRRYGDMQEETPQFVPETVEWFYRALLGVSPRHDLGNPGVLRLMVPESLAQVILDGMSVQLKRKDGKYLTLPLMRLVSGPSLAGGRAYSLDIEETPTRLQIVERSS
jgi:hypothetical protein